MAFKDLFIKPDDQTRSNPGAGPSAMDTLKKQPENNQNGVGVTEPKIDIQPNIVSQTSTVSDVVSNETSEQVIKKLWSYLISQNLPGPDLLELKNSAAALESMGLSVEKRYEAAFKMLKTQYPDFTKQIVLDSIETYKQYISQESETGKRECNEKRKKLIDNTQTHIESLRVEATKIEQQIVELQRQHAEYISQANQLEEQITHSRQLIDNEEKLFNNSVDYVLKQLDTDKIIVESLNI